MLETTERTGQRSHTKEAQEHAEESVARTIEERTAKLPSDLFLWAALGSIGGSLLLQFSGRKERASSSASGRRRS